MEPLPARYTGVRARCRALPALPIQYVIGIDLGTTNCALAYAPVGGDPREQPPVALFDIPQLVNPGEVRDEPLLPSFLYLPGPTDFPAGSIALPWNEAPQHVAGALAQKRGAEVASRLVASAKSWLSHAGVDRTAPILPIQAPEGVAKVSPVEASRRYLEHLRQAWDSKMPDASFAGQQVLVTVPASFDAVARELTLKAAEEAGYKNLLLLEEPQAAFYAWIERHPDWRERVTVGDLILVVDIGGGTTDFTLIAVTEQAGELALERVAVGEHLLLGGDNIDLALARHLEQQLALKGTKLEAMQLQALWQQCRLAKERLLAKDNKKREEPVTILGRGTGLVGGTIKTKLAAEDVERLLEQGFLPAVTSHDTPQRRKMGLAEIGLPYAADAAITRHLARFLRQQAARSEHGSVRRGPSGLAAPTHVLFNGGVLRSGLVRQRLLDVLNGWLSEEGLAPAAPLLGEDLMHAVARGAAYYGLARAGRGVRIRGGVPRTYYVGIESSLPAVPGMRTPVKALTVAPFGMEEGTSIHLGGDLRGREFGLIVGEPAEFRFFQSAVRKNDAAGAMLDEAGDELEELSPVEVTLEAAGQAGEFVPVTLETVVTETGMLQLWSVARDGRRWKLEFNVREKVRSEAS
jgi:molecular chaperone DnaK (HSP70)